MKIRVLATLVLVAISPIGAVRAEETHARVSTANMPPGWQWPPTADMRASGDRCLAALRDAGVEYHMALRAPGKIATPVKVPSMRFGGLSVRQVHGGRAPVMDCHMALALVRHAALFAELGVRELIVAGFYQNRRARLRGRSVPLLSRHALGLAVDIRAFALTDGRVLSVARHHGRPLLARIERALVEYGQLRAVVSPESDRFHRDHVHISAMMTIDEGRPDAAIDVRQLLAGLRSWSNRRVQ